MVFIDGPRQVGETTLAKALLDPHKCRSRSDYLKGLCDSGKRGMLTAAASRHLPHRMPLRDDAHVLQERPGLVVERDDLLGGQ